MSKPEKCLLPLEHKFTLPLTLKKATKYILLYEKEYIW